MKHIPYYLVAGLMMAVGCGNNNNKAGTEAHDHEHTEAHAGHDHEGHSHDSHDEHAHEPGVVEFTEERAKAAGLETEMLKAGHSAPS